MPRPGGAVDAHARARQLAAADPGVGRWMSAVLPIAFTYLVYVVLGAVVSYVLIARATRVAEQAAIDLDCELRELVAQAAQPNMP